MICGSPRRAASSYIVCFALALCTVLSSGLVLTVGARADTGVGSWSATGAMSEGWDGGTAVTLADGDVLAARDSGTTELYEPGSGTWRRGPELPGRGRWLAVALAEGGALLLGETSCGGQEGKCLPTTSVDRLSADNSEISPAAPMSEARVDPVAVRLASGDVLVAGGFGDDECPEIAANGYSCQALASTEVYEPASDRWAPARPMPQARGGASAALLSDGSVVVVGGDGAQDAVRYDPGSETWTATGPTASPRTGSLLLALPGDRALVLGGQPEAGFFGSFGGAGERAEPDCMSVTSEIFTAASSTWTASPVEPAGEENCVYPLGALLAGGQVLLSAQTSSGPTDPYVLDPEQRCWSTTGPPVELRSEGSVVALPDGRALVFGGRAPGGYSLSSAEIYTPGVPTCTPPTSGGSTPSATPNDTPPASSGPKMPPFSGATIAGRGDLSVTASGAVRLMVRCPAEAVGNCAGYVQLGMLMATPGRARIGSHTKHLLLGEASFSAPAGKETPVILRLTEHRRLLNTTLHRWGRAAITLMATAHDSTDQVVTTTTSEALRELNKTRRTPPRR